MSLEDRIRQFAKQARGYLLEEFAKSLEEDTTVVKWQGFNEDGKLTVKNKDLLPAVNGLGQKYATKGSDLILDNAGSVEQRKSRRKQPTQRIKRIEQISKQKIVPRNNIILFDESSLGEGEEIQTMVLGIYVVYYVDELSLNISGDDDDFSFYTSSISSLNSTIFLTNNIPASDRAKAKEMIYIGAAAFGLRTGTPLNGNELGGPSADQPPHTSSASLGAPFNMSGSVSSTTGQAFRHTAGSVQVFGRTTDTSISFEADLAMQAQVQSDYRLFGYRGYSSVSYALEYIAIKNHIYYLQSNPVNGQDQYITIDLEKYVDDSIWLVDIRHSYTTNIKVDNYTEESISFLIFEIKTIDFDQSHEDVDTTTDSLGDTTEDEKDFLRGEIKRWVLHMKINLTTGAIDHTKQQAFIDRYGDDYIEGVNSPYIANGKEYYVRSYARGYREAATASIAFNYGISTEVSGRYFFSNAYEGDWLYEFRNLVLDEADYNYMSDYYRVLRFLEMNYYDGSWYGYINGTAFPYSNAYVYIVTWASSTSGVGAGQANNNDFSDILSADTILLSFYDDRFSYEQFFTEARVGAGNLLTGGFGSGYVPNFNYQVNTQNWAKSFSYVQTAKHDAVGINSYSATLATIFISTALLTSARTGYSVVISGTNLIDGTYTVSNIDENSLIVELTNPSSNPVSPTTETEINGTLARQ